MNFSYFPANSEEDAILLVILGIFLVIWLALLIFCIVSWVFSCLSLHKIAKRRGISKPWLAWIPIGNMWILGSISDQYELRVKAKATSHRKLMLILSVVTFALGIAYGVLSAAIQFGANVVGILLPAYLLYIGAAITLQVFTHIYNYDLYHSCKPERAVVFLVLGAIFPVCQPFFYFACRNRDDGMVRHQYNAAPVTPELPPADSEI